MEEFEKQLKKSAELIDSTLTEKETCRDRAFLIKQEINQLKTKRDNALGNKDYVLEKLAKVDAECEELHHQIVTNEKKVVKLELEKKKAAAQKKFKEASKAQNEIKDFTQLLEEAQAKLLKMQAEKSETEGEIGRKEEEIDQLNQQIKEDQENYERVQLRLLSYRKEDILDLISSIKNMSKVTNSMKASEIKKKTDSLQNELLKIDNELFELEKKYGEFKVKKGNEENVVTESPQKEDTVQ